MVAALLLHEGLGRVGAQVTPSQTPPPPPTAPSPPPPDQAPQPTPTFRTGTSIVRVDVSVWGKGDAAIADLTADDFVVQEDDVPQRIETFQFVKLDGQRPAGDEDSLEIRSPEHGEAEAAREDVRLFAVFLDEYHVDKEPNIALPLREALVDFVNRLGPSDLVTVMDQLTPLSSLRFTRDRQALLERMKKFEGRQGEYLRTRSVMEEAQLQSRNVRYVRAEVSLSALEALVTHLGGLRDGRKSVLFVSQGPPVFFGGREQDLHPRIQSILNAANRGNVTINVLDPRGLGTQGRGGSRDTLFILADETGGRRVVNTNDLVDRCPAGRDGRQRVLPSRLCAVPRVRRREVSQDRGQGEAPRRAPARPQGILGAESGGADGRGGSQRPPGGAGRDRGARQSRDIEGRRVRGRVGRLFAG